MAKIEPKTKQWTRPELVRLGTIKDVAGNGTGPCQGGGGSCAAKS